MKEKLLSGFEKIYGDSKEAECFFAPGRVNLIGEHTDYNGGHVFPCALTIGTYAAVRKHADRMVHFYSMNFEQDGVIEIDLDKKLEPGMDLKWAGYTAGIIWAFAQRDLQLDCGFDILYYGDIPAGSGLSSSASIEVLTGYILRELYGFELTNVDLALIGQFSENKFNGMNCGIMDQFASAMGKKDCAIFLDTADLSYEYAPINLDGMKIVVTNSNVKHSLVTSAYNDRRSSCEKALSELQTVLKINGLGDLSEEQFEENRAAIKDADRQKKTKHAVYENQRTIKAFNALKAGNVELFGKLMNQSHVSLRDDYDVSCEEIDVLVDEAWKISGCVGSRITGGGFGGCTVSIVKDEAVDEFISKVGTAYTNRTGKTADFYVVEIGDGPQRI